MHSLREIISKSAEKSPEVIWYHNSTKSGEEILDRMVRTYTCKKMASSFIYNTIDVSAANAYVIWQELHSENNRIITKNKGKFLVCLGKEFARMSRALPMQKRRAV